MMGIFSFALWGAVTLTVLGFLFWSVWVGLAQKKAWSEFATRYKLSIEKGKRFLDPVSVSGTLNGRELVIYPQIERNEEERTQRVSTHVEVYLNKVPATPFLISKKALPEYFSDVELSQDFIMPSADWPKPAVSRTDDAYVMANWMNTGRLRTLKALLDSAGRGVEVMLMGDGEVAYILWRDLNPLIDPRLLNAIVQKLYGYAKDFDAADTGISAKPNPSSETAPVDNPA